MSKTVHIADLERRQHALEDEIAEALHHRPPDQPPRDEQS